MQQNHVFNDIESIEIFFNEDDNKHHLTIKYKAHFQVEIIIEDTNLPMFFTNKKD